MIDHQTILEIVQSTCGRESHFEENTSPKSISIDKEVLSRVCIELHKNSSVYFDMLTCITGIDNGPQGNTMEVIYHLYSIPFNHSLALKVVLPRDSPEVESISSIWNSANWLEREVFDMFGIKFSNHPDLRKILTPADWEGHPLRKDYKEPEKYRNVSTQYN